MLLWEKNLNGLWKEDTGWTSCRGFWILPRWPCWSYLYLFGEWPDRSFFTERWCWSSGLISGSFPVIPTGVMRKMSVSCGWQESLCQIFQTDAAIRNRKKYTNIFIVPAVSRRCGCRKARAGSALPVRNAGGSLCAEVNSSGVQPCLDISILIVRN